MPASPSTTTILICAILQCSDFWNPYPREKGRTFHWEDQRVENDRFWAFWYACYKVAPSPNATAVC